MQGTRGGQGQKLLPQTNCRSGGPNPKISAHRTTIQLPKRALLVRTQGLMALPQLFGQRLHRDVMAFKATTHRQPPKGDFSETDLFKGVLKSVQAPWGRMDFQGIGA